MKYSIRNQMTALFICVFVFTLLGLFFINTTFLENYYITHKMTDLMETYDSLRTVADEGTLGNKIVQSDILYEVEKKNIDVIVLDGQGNIELTTVNTEDPRYLQIIGDFFGKSDTSRSVIAQENGYILYRTMDDIGGMEYLKMAGFFKNKEGFLLRTPLESVRESAKLSTQFLGYLGLIGIAVGGVFVWGLSRAFTRPIMELAKLSKDMADLNFDAKYTGVRDDEVGILGENFNKMSYQLEKTISELKRANNQLKKDIEQKEKLEQMRTEFLGNVSHELKTPIALIQGYAEGLKEGVNDDPESREFYCDVIMDEAGKMNRMVKNLLVLNQLEFGSDELNFERFDIVSLVHGVIASCEILVHQAGAVVDFISEDSIYVWSDEFKTEQVVRNYLTNAIHHVDNERRIEVRIVRKDDKVTVSVFNSGRPIPEEDVPKIWDKFYKVDKAHTRAYGGNGIGLSIVKAIMESLHQKYGIKNFDNGVAFWFELDAGTMDSSMDSLTDSLTNSLTNQSEDTLKQ